jgi:peptide deformylase
MKLDVLTYPDQRLRNKGLPIAAVTPELQKLANDMIETMYESDGIGLAAPQVGMSVRLIVVDTRSQDEDGNYITENLTELEQKVAQPMALFNPEIVEMTEKTSYEEGCLSVPGFFETVERANYIEMHALDINGKKVVIKTDGLLAICLQHELDHLEGKLFIDRISFVKSNRIKTKIKKHGYPTAEEVAEERAERREAKKKAKAESGN